MLPSSQKDVFEKKSASQCSGYLVPNMDHWKEIKDLIAGCLQFWCFWNAFQICPPQNGAAEVCAGGGWQERARECSEALQKGQGLSLVLFQILHYTSFF